MPMASILDAVMRDIRREEDIANGMGVYMTYRSENDYLKPGARVRLGHIAPEFFEDALKFVAVYKYVSPVCLTGGKFEISGMRPGEKPTMDISELSYDMVRSQKCCGKPGAEATIADCLARMRGGKCNDPLMARIAAMMTWEKGQGK